MSLPATYRIGSLRESVRVERLSAGSTDSRGMPISAYAPVITGIPAKIGPTKGGEAIQDARVRGTGYFDIVVRSDSDTETITTEDRLVDERIPTRVYNIRWIANLDERNRFLIMTCELGVADS